MFLVHLLAVLIPIFIGINSSRKFKQIKYPYLTPFAFVSLGLASLFEMIDHTTTNWIYIDHSSIFNWLFYSFLSIGLSLFTISVVKNKYIISTSCLMIIAAILSYWFLGKSTTIILQVFISILLVSQWWIRFNDWVLFIYPITGILFTTYFGILLSISGEQIWHVFIGPSGTISVLSFYSVLERSRRKEIFLNKRK